MGSSDPDAFETLDSGPEVEVRIKGSRFLGQAFHVRDTPDASACLDEVRRRYHDATHHCWASVLGNPASPEERYDDDGEPARTAGPPILASLRRAEVTDALVVVTRYFGGTKLGTGGLTRAYGEAAEAVVSAAPRRQVWITDTLCVRFDFADLGAVENVLSRWSDAILGVNRGFEPEPEATLTVKHSRTAPLAAALTEASAGRVRLITL